jgi:hypothetical protein
VLAVLGVPGVDVGLAAGPQGAVVSGEPGEELGAQLDLLAGEAPVGPCARLPAVTPSSPGPDAVKADLLTNPIGAADVRARVSAVSGLYAWWASPATLPTLVGPLHPSVPDLRLLYVGIATKLRSPLASNHLGRTGSSTLRRTLADLLLDDEQYRTRWTDRLVLLDDHETRLTVWMPRTRPTTVTCGFDTHHGSA